MGGFHTCTWKPAFVLHYSNEDEWKQKIILIIRKLRPAFGNFIFSLSHLLTWLVKHALILSKSNKLEKDWNEMRKWGGGKEKWNGEKQSNGPTGFLDWHRNVFSSMIDIAGSRFLRAGRPSSVCNEMLKCLAAVSVYIGDATGSANPLVNQSPMASKKINYTYYTRMLYSAKCKYSH